MNFIVPVALNPDFLLKTLNVHATIFFFLKSSLCFQWEIFLDSEGRIIDSKALKKRIFYGGVEHSTCKEVCSLLSANSCLLRLFGLIC